MLEESIYFVALILSEMETLVSKQSKPRSDAILCGSILFAYNLLQVSR